MSSYGSQSISHRGITSQHYNYLRCWFTLIYYGKDVFHTIFRWGFKRPPELIKEALFENPNYTNKKYRSDFDASQRSKIEHGAIDEFDISLYYLLLQRVCALPGPSDISWGREADSESLPSILCQIKVLRNTMAHAHVDITEQMMKDEINNLDILFSKALTKAGVVFNVVEEEVIKSKDKISAQLLSIKSVDSFAIDQLRKNAEQKLTLAAEEAKLELLSQYERLSKVVLAPWTVVESLQNINDIFTEPLLKHNKHNVLFQQLEAEETFIDVSEILVSRLNDNTLPNYILLVSKSGMGKTTLAKYVVQSWLTKNQKVKGVDEVDLVLYMDCRFMRCATFEEFLIEILPNTVHLFGRSELKLLITTMKVLAILDNIDELRDETVSMYEDLLKMNNDRFRILATSAHNVAASFSRPFQQKHLLLDLEGFSSQNISTCVSKIYSTMFGNKTFDDTELQFFCSEYKIHTNENIRSPEVLSHIFFHWVMHNKNNSGYSTKTQIFRTTHDIICVKLLEKIGVNVQTNLVERKLIFDRLNKFFKKLFQKSFEMFVRGRCEISPTIYEELKNECAELELPCTKILKEILYFKDVHTPFIKLSSITFTSASMQIFYAAMYFVDILIGSNQDVKELLPDCVYINKNILLFFKFVVGLIVANDTIAFEKLISNIFSCINDRCSVSSSAWVEFVEETRCNPAAICDIKQYMGNSWSFEDHEISATLFTLLKSHSPSQLSLTSCINPCELSCLSNTLEICSQIKDLSIFLHLYYNFWVDKNSNCDNCLYKFLNNNSKAKVESFAGKLSATAILKVPAGIKRLALHVGPEDITILNYSLIRLTSLVLLYLNFDINTLFPAKRVPRLKLPRNNIVLYVDLWKINEDSISWSCKVLAALSPAYCKVTLRKTRFTFKLAQKWLEELRNHRIHVDSLSIGSIVPLSLEEIENLRELSSSFECLDFKWLLL